MNDKHKYIEIVKFYQDEVRHHEEAIKELTKMLEQLEGTSSFKEMDYSAGGVPDQNLGGGKNDEE